jgi:hypothetical protein
MGGHGSTKTTLLDNVTCGRCRNAWRKRHEASSTVTLPSRGTVLVPPRAESFNGNTQKVRAILAAFQGDVLTLDEVVEKLAKVCK